MINLLASNHDKQHRNVHSSLKRCYGAATLLFSTALLTLSALLIIFAAQYGVLQDKSISNMTRSNQAYEAAQAGMNFAINYLRTNSAVILANTSGGYLQPYTSTAITNVSLGSNSQFTVTYTNPIADNYSLITITSTGSSDDGTSTKVISQQVQFGSLIQNPPTVPLLSKGNVDLGGSSEIINIYNNNTVITGGQVEISGSANTTLASGVGSNSSTTGPDITENDATYTGMSDSEFFQSIFNGDPASIQNGAQYTYTNSGNTNYSSLLNGITGSSIWINQTSGEARFSGNVVIGSPSDPVLLVIDGNAKFSGTLTVYGFVFILGSSETDLTGNVNIVGSISTSGSLDARGNIEVNYDPTVLDNLKNNPGMSYLAKVPGTWKDFQ